MRMAENDRARQAKKTLVDQLRGHPAVGGVRLISAPHSATGHYLLVTLRRALRGGDAPVPDEIDGVGVFTRLARGLRRAPPPEVDVDKLAGGYIPSGRPI